MEHLRHHIEEDPAIAGFDYGLLVGTSEGNGVALATHGLVIDERMYAVAQLGIGGDPLWDLDTSDFVANPQIKKVDGVLAVEGSIGARHRQINRSPLTFGQALAINVGVGQIIAGGTRRLASGCHIATAIAVGAFFGGDCDVGAKHHAHHAHHFGRAWPANIRRHWDALGLELVECGEVGVEERGLHDIVGIGEIPAHQCTVLECDRGQIFGQIFGA